MDQSKNCPSFIDAERSWWFKIYKENVCLMIFWNCIMHTHRQIMEERGHHGSNSHVYDLQCSTKAANGRTCPPRFMMTQRSLAWAILKSELKGVMLSFFALSNWSWNMSRYSCQDKPLKRAFPGRCIPCPTDGLSVPEFQHSGICKGAVWLE